MAKFAVEEDDRTSGYKKVHAAGCRHLRDPEPFESEPTLEALFEATAGYVVATELRGSGRNYHGPVVFTGGVDEDGNTLPLDAQQAERFREHVELLAAL